MDLNGPEWNEWVDDFLVRFAVVVDEQRSALAGLCSAFNGAADGGALLSLRIVASRASRWQVAAKIALPAMPAYSAAGADYKLRKSPM